MCPDCRRAFDGDDISNPLSSPPSNCGFFLLPRSGGPKIPNPVNFGVHHRVSRAPGVAADRGGAREAVWTHSSRALLEARDGLGGQSMA